MRKIIALLACLLPLAAGAYTSMQFNFSVGNQNIAPFTNVEVILQQVGINQSATMTYLGEPIYQWTDTNATTTFANLQTAAAGATSYWQWTVPANSTPNGPARSYSGYIQVTSTNLGTVNASLWQVFAVPTPTGLGWAYSAQTSDLRYAQGTNSGSGFALGQYVAGSNTNALVGFLGVDTNFNATESSTITANLVGPLPAWFTNGLATTNYVIGATNGFTTIVYSNPAAYTTPPQATNIANAAANAVGLNDTNYATGATNIAVSNLTTALIGTNNALVAALSATNTALLADIVAATNGILNVSQPGSLILTNLSGTGALTNGLAAGQNFALTTNGSGTLIILNATNQTWLTNGLGPWVGLLPSSYLQTNSLPGLTNGFVTQSVTNGLATLQAATNAAGGVYSNNPLGYVTATITNGFATTNFAYPVSNPSNFISSASTNAMATTNFVVAYSDTNGAARAAVAALNYQPGSQALTNISGTGALTNALAAGQNFSLTTNGSGTIITLNATNQTWLTNHILDAYAPTNTLNGWYDTNGAGLAASLTASNNMLPVVTNIARQFASANVNTNQYAAGQNVNFTTNIAGTVITVNATNQTFLTNGILNGYAQTNLLVTWFDTNGAALVQYTNAVNTSTNYAYTNTAAQVATALNFASTNTALPFVPTNAGTVNALTITTSLQFGADTNFILGTNWITVKGAGSGQANGVYDQISPGIYTNNNFPGISIVNSGGVYNLLNTNGQTLYVTNTVNGFWLVGPYGAAPRPYVAYSPTFDPILLGNVYATNLAAQWQAYVAQFITNPTNGISSSAASNIVLNYGSTLYQPLVGGTNGVSAGQVTNIVTGMTNRLATTNWVGGNFIASANGLGTNFNGFGTTTMNNSNLTVSYLPGAALIPQMTSATMPSGVITGGSPWQNPYTNFYAFQTNEPIGLYWAPTFSPAWIEYDFGYNVTVATVSAQFQSSAGGTGPYYGYLSNSVDGVNWTRVTIMTNVNSDVVQTISNTLASTTTARYWIWNFPKPASSQDSIISQLQLYSTPLNLVGGPSGIEIQSSTYGVGINTNINNGNALEVNGYVDSSLGYTVNGLPAFGQNTVTYIPLYTNVVFFGSNNISGTFFNYSGLSYSAYQVYGAPSYNTNLNGVYVSATNNNAVYTNSFGYAMFFNYGTVQAIATNANWSYTNLYGATNVWTRLGNYGQVGSYLLSTLTTNSVSQSSAFVTVGYANPSVLSATVMINTNATPYSAALTVAGSMTASAYDVYSNAWNLNLATNGMPNFCTRFNVSSNGFPVNIYMSNGTPFIYYTAIPGGGTLP
jgi:hypothetical protein